MLLRREENPLVGLSVGDGRIERILIDIRPLAVPLSLLKQSASGNDHKLVSVK